MREIEKNYSYSRNNNYLSRYNSKKSKAKGIFRKPDRKTIEKTANQLIASTIIALIIIVAANFNNPFIVKAVDSVKWVVVTNYDFSAAANNIIPSISNIVTGISSKINGEDAVDVSSNSVSIMIIPVDGKITSGFGTREDPINIGKKEQHNGIDIDGVDGTPIKCALDGTVTKIEESDTLGRVVRVKHSDGLETLYGHCSEILVDENQTVKQGEIIAKIGHTGNVTAPHLHFEVIKDSKGIDPLSVIGGSVEAR